MQSVVKEIKVGHGGDITILNEAMWGDEVLVEEQEGHSILYNFLGFLNIMQRARISNGTAPLYHFTDADGFEQTFEESVESISSVDASTSPIRLTFASDIFDDSGNQDIGAVKGVMVGGVQGNDALNGTFIDNFTKVSDTACDISVATTGSEDVSLAKGVAITDGVDSSIMRQTEYFFSNPKIFLGGSTLANTTGQVGMNDFIVPGNKTGQLDYGSVNINTPVIDLNQQISTITISRDITNDTGADIPIESAILETEMTDAFQDPNAFVIIGRDLLSTTLPAKTTATFNYKFRTTCKTTGGILVQFNELFYRQLAHGSRTVQDVDNANQTDEAGENNFHSSAAGGDNSRFSRSGGIFNSKYSDDQYRGIQVGASTQVVDEGDFSLKNRINHGDSTDQMIYQGQRIGFIEKDEANDRYFYDVTRYFENLSGSTLSVNEVGYNIARINGSDDYAAQIFRHRVDPEVSVQDGETLKVTYRVSVKPKA